MFRKKTKTPDVLAKDAKDAGLPLLPGHDHQTSESTVITKDTLSNSIEPPPEIKSVGVSLQPPTVKPQQAELNAPQITFDDGSNQGDGTMVHQNFAGRGTDADPFGEFQSHNDTGGFDNTEFDDPVTSTSPKDTRTRTKTQEPGSKAKKSINKQLSTVAEVTSSDERTTRPTTAAALNHPIRTESDENLDEIGSHGSMKHKSPPPVPKKVVVAKKKLTQIDSPEQRRAAGAGGGVTTVPLKKAKLKPALDTGLRPPGIAKSGTAAAVPVKKLKPKVTISEEVDGADSQEVSLSLASQSESESQEQLASQSIDEVKSSESFDEVEASMQLDVPSPRVERERTPSSKKPTDSARLAKPKKAATPKPATAPRPASSRPRSEKQQRRPKLNFENDGFSAMGLSPADEFHEPRGAKDTHKRVANQPAPPPHYLTPTAAIPTKRETPKQKELVSRNPSSRRKAIRNMAYEVENDEVDDEEGTMRHVGRFGHYDVDDKRSKSMDPGEYRNTPSRQRMTSDYVNGMSRARNDDDMYEDENIQELERGVEVQNRRAMAYDDEINSNSSQGYRYSDRISGKYNVGNAGRSGTMQLSKAYSNGALPIPDRLMLSSSALKAAQSQGMISPETVNYLKWYMVKATPLEPTPQGSLTNIKQTTSKGPIMMDDNDPPRGRARVSTKPPAASKLRDSIMDDEEEPMSKPVPVRKPVVKKFTPIRTSGSIMDEDAPATQTEPKPRVIPKTRVTIVSKPKPVVKKTPAMPEAQTPNFGGGSGFWGQQPQQHPFMNQPFPNFSPYPSHPFTMQNQFHNLPNYTPTPQAPLPSLHSLSPMSNNPFIPPAPTVHPGLMPARIKLTTVPVVTFKQSYVIEPTGHAPGTYIPPEEMGVDGAGGMMTYIAAGMFPQGGEMMGGGGGGFGQQPMHIIQNDSSRRVGTATSAATTRTGGAQTRGGASLQSKTVIGKTGVRSQIQKGQIGRAAASRTNNR
ncbi:hypothetical protein HDU98_006443 [Podochytrium sp. JEL0797]|nr:hypothetical protein HDU98_006443 [Podochytrium sp. JEL0797]